MKAILIGLISLLSFSTGSTAMADALGGENDTYIGFQMIIPLDASRASLMSGRIDYSAVLINQENGIRDGLVFAQDRNGTRTLGYLRPSQVYRIGQSRVSDYTIPIVSLNKGIETPSSYSNGEMVLGLVAGIVLVATLVKETTDEITDCLDPDTDSEEIAGC